MNWLITGGCGFIGTNLIARLLTEDGQRIRVLDNLSVGQRADLARVTEFGETTAGGLTSGETPWPAGVTLLPGDILDEEVCKVAAQGADVVVHLAANTGVAPSVEDPRSDCHTNVTGTLNMLEAARHVGVGRFVFASSGAPLGEVEPPIHERLAPRPVSPYGASKLAGEGYCSAYYRTFGVQTVALRFGNVYGPRSIHKSSVVANFIKKASTGDVLEVYGDGSQTRDFVFVEDLVAAVHAVAHAEGIGGELFQIATSRETTVGELVETMLPVFQEAGFPPATVRNAEARLGDVQRNFADTSKARDRLGWQARVSLGEGLRRTVRWFLEHNPAVAEDESRS